jgi:phosphoserine phosphatase RsbU/P
MEAVRRYAVLDAPGADTFDRIAALAARLLDVPVAVVSVVEEDRIRLVASHGLDGVTELAREPGLCASAILGTEPWVVTDAANDPRTVANPLVTGDLGVRFYAGVPLTTSDGFNLGTLCVIDRQPRSISDEEVGHLQDLARLVVDELELRLHSRQLVTAEAQLRREAEQLADTLQATLLPPVPPDVPGMDLCARFRAGEEGLRIGGDFYDVFRLGANDWGIVLGDACGRGAAPATLAATTRWCVRAAAVRTFSPSAVLRDVNAVLLGEDHADDQYCTAVFARIELDTCGAWVTVANAGHPRPVMVRASDQLAARGGTALPLGLFDGWESTDVRVGLGPGDYLVLYTDGITEARRRDGAFFGEEGLERTLQACVGAACASDVADAVMAAAEAFADEGFADDAAVLVLRVPVDAGADPLGRVVQATGIPEDELSLPGYPHDAGE